MLLRRNLVGLSAAAFLAGCAGGTDIATQFAQARAYADALIGATLAGAQQFLAAAGASKAAPMVQAAIDRLESLRPLLASVTVPTDWKTAAVEALAVLQQLLPIIGPALGPVSVEVALAVAVVQAFVNALPPPATAPPTPPAALVRKSLEYHRR